MRFLPAARHLLPLLAVAALAACSPSDDKVVSSARERIQKQDYDGARVQLKGLLQKKPKLAEARYLLGRVMAANGDPAGAEAEFRRALDLGYPGEDVVPPLAGVMLSLDKAEQVLAQFADTKLTTPASVAELKTNLAAAYAQRGDRAATDKALAEALGAVPDHPAAIVLQARLKASRGDLDGALDMASKLAERVPNNLQAQVLHGDILQGKGKSTEAMAAWRKALALQPNNAGVHTALITVLIANKDVAGATTQWTAMSKVLPQHPQTLFFDAVLAGNRGDYLRVRELTQNLLRGAPDNPRVLMMAGEAEMKLNNMGQAESMLGRAVQLLPKAPLPRRMLAQVQLRNRQPDKALTTLAPLLDVKPADSEVLALAGQAQLMKGDKGAAEVTFNKAAQASPDDTRMRAVRALTRLGQGNDTETLKELETLAAKDEGARVDLALLSAKLRRGDIPGALQALETMTAKMPKHPLPDQLRGRIAIMRGDKADARKQFEAALLKDGNYLPALASLADLDLAEQKPDDARARFDALLKREPKNASAMLALFEIAARGNKQDEAQEWLEKAIKATPNAALPRLLQLDYLTSLRQPGKAMTLAQAAVAALPDDAELRDRLGRIELAAGQTQQAVASYNKLVQMQPKSARAQLLLAEAQVAAKNPAGATAAIKKAQELDPDSPAVTQALVQNALREGKTDMALSYARRLQQLQPGEPLGYAIEGEIAARRDQWPLAVAAYRKAVSSKSAGSDVAARLHGALLKAGKTDDADKLAVDWLKSRPDDPGFLIYLGDLAMGRKQNDEAEKHYRQVLAKHPDTVLALNNLAFLLASQGKPGAVQMAERAVALAPNQAALLDTLALSLSAENQLKKAVDAQNQAVKLAPDVATFRLQLAKLQLKAGDKLAARSELVTLSKLGSKFEQQAEVAELMKTVN